MNLFDNEKFNQEPLAKRMCPTSLEDFMGQKHILAKDKLLYRAIQADRLGSIILTGPPGTGKTSLATVIAQTTKSYFITINATVAGKKEMVDVIQEAKKRKITKGQKTILFVDEIHSFNWCNNGKSLF